MHICKHTHVYTHLHTCTYTDTHTLTHALCYWPCIHPRNMPVNDSSHFNIRLTCLSLAAVKEGARDCRTYFHLPSRSAISVLSNTLSPDPNI